MSNESALSIPPENRSVKDWLTLPAYRDRFTEVLGKRGPQFMAAITAVSQMPGLRDAKPLSVIASAMVAATLDLPVNPTLGQAYIVAYSGEAQFQIGYKGLIQLALRSGQYRRMNAGPLNAEVFAGYDGVGEPKLDWSKYEPAKEVGGYFCAFELVNGFTKVVYWSKAQCEAHAKRFSKAYARGFATPWKSDFDGMATKTVIKNALTKWGMLSVEMQKAVVHDQGVQVDVDADVKYLDGEDETMPGDPVARPAPKPRSPKGAALAKENTPAAPKEVVVTEAEQAQAAAEAPAVPTTQPPAGKVFTQSSTAATADAPAHEPPPAATGGEPLKAEQKALLGDGIVLTTDAKILSFQRLVGKRQGSDHPYIEAQVESPEFKGKVVHSDGGIGGDGKPLPIWQTGATVSVVLKGVKYTNGRHATIVDKIEAIAAAPQSVADEV